MNEVPQDLKYSKSHEWVRIEDDHFVTVGITDHAQESLGDLVFIELPEVGQTVELGDECAVVESVKAASDVYSPVTGEVVEVNVVVIDKPELVNSSPYEDGWLFKVKLDEDDDSLDTLLNAREYSEFLKTED
jgi:glycine cleavage system H protein